MKPQDIPFIPRHVVLRRYEEINIIDLKADESYVIDDEAYSVLKLIDGELSNGEIIDTYPEAKKQEVSEAIKDFHELEIVNFSPTKITDKALISVDHINIPEKNAFDLPHMKNLMINLTEKCNLTCKHCYITDKNPVDFPFENLKKIISEFYELQGLKLVLTGGEPLLYSPLKELLVFLKDIPLMKIMLSNGILFKENPELIGLLSDNYFETFISIDGLEETHNDFRDANCYKDTLESIKLLIKKGITVSINTMVHKQNLNEFDEMYKLFQSLEKIKNWSIDIPTFDKTTPQAIREKYEITSEEGGQILNDYGWGEYINIASRSDLACGPNIIAIDVLGVVTKCGFFYDENVGSVLEIGLKKSWELIQKQLNWKISDLECFKLNCEHLDACRGGCRYRAYQATGNVLGVDSYKCAQFGKTEFLK